MTVKVFMTDGRIEEYPNAYITWEWDDADGELGSNSGFRINATDKNFTHISAFVYPSECDKIEITSEECDKVFKSPPGERTISAKRFRLFSEIDKERQRQDEKFGEQNHPMLGQPFTRKYIQELLESSAEKFEEHNTEDQYKSWYSILEEGICRAFAETEPEKQRAEMVQVASVAVAIIECLDRRMGKNGKN